MSVIVKGMEMPTCCEWCAVEKYEQNSDGYIIDSWCPLVRNEPSTLKIRTESRHPLCPLRPLPEKHGRLIDANWLKETIITTLEELRKNPKMDGQEMHLIAAFTTLLAMIGNAPTIVEAEGDYG